MRLAMLTGLLLLLPFMAGGLQAQTPVRPGALSANGEATVYTAPTVSDFLLACKKDRSGCMDAVGNALMEKDRFDGSSDICVTSVSYGDAVPGWLGAHPETSKAPPADGIFTALKALYPC